MSELKSFLSGWWSSQQKHKKVVGTECKWKSIDEKWGGEGKPLGRLVHTCSSSLLWIFKQTSFRWLTEECLFDCLIRITTSTELFFPRDFFQLFTENIDHLLVSTVNRQMFLHFIDIVTEGAGTHWALQVENRCSRAWEWQSCS